MGTLKDHQPELARMLSLQKAHQKCALSLWIKLQKASGNQYFDVLLTLKHAPSVSEVQRLQKLGLQISDFHQAQPSQLLPGVASKVQLEEGLLHCEMIDYIEGVFHQPK